MKHPQNSLMICLLFTSTLHASANLVKTASPTLPPKSQTAQQTSLSKEGGEQGKPKNDASKLSKSLSTGYTEGGTVRTSSPLSSSSGHTKKVAPPSPVLVAYALDSSHQSIEVKVAPITSIEAVSESATNSGSTSSTSRGEGSPRPLERRTSKLNAVLSEPRRNSQGHSSESSSTSTAQTEIRTTIAEPLPDITKLQPVELYELGLSTFKAEKYAHAYHYLFAANNQSESSVHQLLSARWLGEIVLRGWSVPVDFNAALSYLKEAAKQDVDKAVRDEALVLLGEMYYFSLGVKQSPITAIDYFRKIVGTDEELFETNKDLTELSKRKSLSALPESALPALFYLQKIFSTGQKKGNETADNFRSYAHSLCKQVIELVPNSNTEVLAYMILGRLASTQKVAEEHFIKVTHKGKRYLVSEASYRLGKLYYEQLLVAVREYVSKKDAKEKKQKQDSKEAKKRALQLREKAIQCLERASHQEINKWVKPMAHIYLGHIYRIGIGKDTIPQMAKAVAEYEKAVEQSYNLRAQAEAAFLCARIYETGDEGVSRNLAKAHSYDCTVAEWDCSVGLLKQAPEFRVTANFLLGLRYYHGSPEVPLNLQTAFKHFKRVTEESLDPKQLEEAWYRLAEMLSERKGGIKGNIKMAREYYEKIHTHGKNPAYIHRALCRLGEIALRKRDFKAAEANLQIAKELIHDPIAQRDAQVAYALLEKKRTEAASTTNNDDNESDDE